MKFKTLVLVLNNIVSIYDLDNAPLCLFKNPTDIDGMNYIFHGLYIETFVNKNMFISLLVIRSFKIDAVENSRKFAFD